MWLIIVSIIRMSDLLCHEQISFTEMVQCMIKMRSGLLITRAWKIL